MAKKLRQVVVLCTFMLSIFTVCAYADSKEEKFRQGEALFNQGKYQEAFNLLKSSADKGYAPAMNAVGFCYQNGKGVSKNSSYALQYYMNASVQGDLEGTYNYGWMHLRGDCSRDRNLAKKYLVMAANGGHSKAKEILREEGWGETETQQPVLAPRENESTPSYVYEENTPSKDTYTPHSRPYKENIPEEDAYTTNSRSYGENSLGQGTHAPSSNSWYTGSWNSTINNLIDHPKTVCLRIEVMDSETNIPVSNVQISFEGDYWIPPKTSRDVGGERNARIIEYETSCRTDSRGIAVASFTWNKKYPWSLETDEVEKAQIMKFKHPNYQYREFQTPFSEFLQVGQKKTSSYPVFDDTFQEIQILEAFENALANVYSYPYTQLVVLDLGTGYSYFDQSNSTRPEFYKKVYSKDWGEVFEGPQNLFKTGKGSGRSWCGPYLIYDMEIKLEPIGTKIRF